MWEECYQRGNAFFRSQSCRIWYYLWKEIHLETNFIPRCEKIPLESYCNVKKSWKLFALKMALIYIAFVKNVIESRLCILEYPKYSKGGCELKRSTRSAYESAYEEEILGPKYSSVYDCRDKFEPINKLVSWLLVCYANHISIQICRPVTNCNLPVPYWTWAPERVIDRIAKSFPCYGRLDLVNFIPFIVDLTYGLTLIKWHGSYSLHPEIKQSTSRFILGLLLDSKDAFDYLCWSVF